MKIAHIGYASCVSSTSCTSFSLHDLLHVPNITKNLLSVSKFARDNNVFFEFHPHSCYIKHQVTKQILLQGTLKDDLYIFPDLRSNVFFLLTTLLPNLQNLLFISGIIGLGIVVFL